MNLSTNLKQELKDRFTEVFDDKEISLFSSVVVQEDDGWTRKDEVEETGTFFGSVNFSNLGKVQEQYGIRDDIDITITTSEDVPTEQIIGYLDKTYKVIQSIKQDFRTLLIAQEWSSKLSIWISA